MLPRATTRYGGKRWISLIHGPAGGDGIDDGQSIPAIGRADDIVSFIAVVKAGSFFRHPYGRKISTLCLDSASRRRAMSYGNRKFHLITKMEASKSESTQSNRLPHPPIRRAKAPKANTDLPRLNQWRGRSDFDERIIQSAKPRFLRLNQWRKNRVNLVRQLLGLSALRLMAQKPG